jgi:hypothetical protein
MNWLTRFFLRAKSWEIFILSVGVVVLLQIPMFISNQGESIRLDWGPALACMLCINTWFWVVGSFLNSIVLPKLRPGLALFRFALLYPVLYLAGVVVFSPPPLAMLGIVIFPLHLLAVGCMFYLLSFVSKNLALAETGKEVTFYDYAGPFFLLWFFPIGVWIVQPRMNRLYAERKNGDAFGEATAS